MSNSYVDYVTKRTITSTETVTTIAQGEAVTAWGTLCNTTAGFVGVAAYEAAPGEPITVVTGRCWVKFAATPGSHAELTVDANGQFAVAASTNVVVGYQLEAEIADNPVLGIAEIAPVLPFVKA